MSKKFIVIFLFNFIFTPHVFPNSLFKFTHLHEIQSQRLPNIFPQDVVSKEDFSGVWQGQCGGMDLGRTITISQKSFRSISIEVNNGIESETFNLITPGLSTFESKDAQMQSIQILTSRWNPAHTSIVLDTNYTRLIRPDHTQLSTVDSIIGRATMSICDDKLLIDIQAHEYIENNLQPGHFTMQCVLTRT